MKLQAFSYSQPQRSVVFLRNKHSVIVYDFDGNDVWHLPLSLIKKIEAIEKKYVMSDVEN